jgi:hypothetical protein
MEFILLLIIGGVALYYLKTHHSPEHNLLKWGDLNEQLICPHCQKKGFTHAQSVKRKEVISGGKATALPKNALAIFKTGLSYEEGFTQAHCTKCNSTWNL